ncbi:MAG: hypothetical protein OEV45_09470 [Desulfobacteraceae bacterium]|nr:hypothetical protein [Desulfobacteraceae bacterium]
MIKKAQGMVKIPTSDRLDLPADVSHNAVVGNEGVVRILFAVLFICSYPLALDADINTWTTDWGNKET